MKKFLVLFCVSIFLVGCSNPHTPEGCEGYVREKPIVWGEGGFRGIVKGPGNFGASIWQNKVINIDFRPKTYSEGYKILSKDELNITFASHLIMKIRPGTVKRVVENYGGVNFFAQYIKEKYRSTVREKTQVYNAFDAKENRVDIASASKKTLDAYLQDTPFEIISLEIGNIEYPESVTKEIELKLAAEQRLERKQTEIQITESNAKIEVARAKGIAEAQNIIKRSLTKAYLQYEAIQAQLKMAESPNTTVMYIPVGNMGVPLVKDLK